MEEFERQRYARDNEDPVAWSILDLAKKEATTPALGFYPLSKFTVFKSSSSFGLDFPSFTHVSNNHYKAEWSLSKTLRRLKNVIVVLEWHPLALGAMTADAHHKKMIRDWSKNPMSAKMEQYLERSFSLLDTKASTNLTKESVKEVL